MNARLVRTALVVACLPVVAAALGSQLAYGQYPNIELNLPKHAVARRAALVERVEPGTKRTFADLEGPGCIRHIWVVGTRTDLENRDIIVRLFFDGEETPYVEAPLGDFFGVMHGKAWYPINTALLSVQAKSGYNCYFPMPFARSARLEFESGERAHGIYCMVDWHEYPDQPMEEKQRFCARWRREFPTERYGEDFLMFDADGPGRLVGFVYGVRLLDNVDRWSHGGADNIYIDGDGRRPSYVRGIGGEDVFGTAYGGATHTPGTHLNAEMPYYVHEDIGEARPAQNVVGYRWYLNDAIEFEKSIHLRFGCMSNDICATVYWYAERPVRPYFRLPEFKHLVPGRESLEIKRGTHDLPLPDAGTWRISPATDDPSLDQVVSGGSGAAAGAGPAAGDVTDWIKRPSMHGFVDFGHVHRPEKRGAGVYHVGAAAAECVLATETAGTAKLRLAWDDRLVLRVNDGPPIDLGTKKNFGDREIEVPLAAGKNRLRVTLSNTQNYNHGGWAFAFQALAADGKRLLPQAE
jgi:hypothetical protein